jgi:hypothetical protein
MDNVSGGALSQLSKKDTLLIAFFNFYIAFWDCEQEKNELLSSII